MINTQTLNIRLANIQDLASITMIYNQMIQSGPATAQLDPVRLENLIKWFEAHDRERYPVYLAESAGSVLGYLNLSPYRPGRRALNATAEVSYFVEQNQRHSGVASALMEHVLQECARLNIKNLMAILLETNAPSIGLLEKFGFQRWAHLPNIAEIDDRSIGQYYYGINLDTDQVKQVSLTYHHLGVPSPQPLKDERHLPHLKMFVSGYGENPYGIEWLRYEKDADYPDIVKQLPHLAFEVSDLKKALEGKQVIIESNSPSPGVMVAFIEECGLPIELMQIDRRIAHDNI